MKPAMRGVVWGGEVWAWPTLLMTHNEAFAAFGGLSKYSCRWRQWSAESLPEFDPGASDEDAKLVIDYLERNDYL